MRTKPYFTSGSARTRTLVVVLILAAIGGLVFFLFLRPPPSTPRVRPPAAPPELSRSNLELVEGRLRPTGQTTPFNGFMLEHYADGVLRSRSAISNGVLHGLSQGWHTNAQLQVSEQFKEGLSHGLRTKWYPDGARQSEAHIVDGKLNGNFRKWHENGTLSEQVDFVADQPNGLSLSWFPSGYLKARVMLKDGKPVEQQFWKDGEKKGSSKPD